MSKGTNIVFYSKGMDRPLGAHLRLSEIDCRCSYYSCKRTLSAEITIDSFNSTREEFGSAIYINSGYRCQRHNTDIGGIGDSKHKLGLALDLAPADKVDLDLLVTVAKKYFDVVIRYDSFIHCHNESGLY